MSDKKFSPREAALMVLAKAQELYKSSTLVKAEMKKDMGQAPAPMAPAAPMPAAAPAPMDKSDESGKNPDEKADAELGEKVEQEVHSHEEKNADPAHEAPMKGHIKLAKFVGRMELKKGQKMIKSETGDAAKDAQGYRPNGGPAHPGKN